MRKQYHFWPGVRGLDAWDVDELVTLSSDLPVEEVPLSHIHEIDSVYWLVDTSHPIILGPDGRVMDGMHRVIRALIEGRETIAARRLPALPEPTYRNCRPEDLPYPE